MRLITTVADNAIQGPSSVHFSEEERRVDNLEDDMLAEAIFKLHIAAFVGGGVDNQFIETISCDRLLRLVRRHFVLGQAILYFGELRINSQILLRYLMLKRKLGRISLQMQKPSSSVWQ